MATNRINPSQLFIHGAVSDQDVIDFYNGLSGTTYTTLPEILNNLPKSTLDVSRLVDSNAQFSVDVKDLVSIDILRQTFINYTLASSNNNSKIISASENIDNIASFSAFKDGLFSTNNIKTDFSSNFAVDADQEAEQVFSGTQIYQLGADTVTIPSDIRWTSNTDLTAENTFGSVSQDIKLNYNVTIPNDSLFLKSVTLSNYSEHLFQADIVFTNLSTYLDRTDNVDNLNEGTLPSQGNIQKYIGKRLVLSRTVDTSDHDTKLVILSGILTVKNISGNVYTYQLSEIINETHNEDSEPYDLVAGTSELPSINSDSWFTLPVAHMWAGTEGNIELSNNNPAYSTKGVHTEGFYTFTSGNWHNTDGVIQNITYLGYLILSPTVSPGGAYNRIKTWFLGESSWVEEHRAIGRVAHYSDQRGIPLIVLGQNIFKYNKEGSAAFKEHVKVNIVPYSMGEGTPIPFANELASPLSALEYQIDDATKRVWDPNSSITIHIADQQHIVNASDIPTYIIDYHNGIITFDSDPAQIPGLNSIFDVAISGANITHINSVYGVTVATNSIEIPSLLTGFPDNTHVYLDYDLNLYTEENGDKLNTRTQSHIHLGYPLLFNSLDNFDRVPDRDRQYNIFKGEVGDKIQIKTTFFEDEGTADNLSLIPTNPEVGSILPYEGMAIWFSPKFENTGAARVQISNSQFYPLRNPDGTEISARDLITDSLYIAIFNNDTFLLRSILSRESSDVSGINVQLTAIHSDIVTNTADISANAQAHQLNTNDLTFTRNQVIANYDELVDLRARVQNTGVGYLYGEDENSGTHDGGLDDTITSSADLAGKYVGWTRMITVGPNTNVGNLPGGDWFITKLSNRININYEGTIVGNDGSSYIAVAEKRTNLESYIGISGGSDEDIVWTAIAEKQGVDNLINAVNTELINTVTDCRSLIETNTYTAIYDGVMDSTYYPGPTAGIYNFSTDGIDIHSIHNTSSLKFTIYESNTDTNSDESYNQPYLFEVPYQSSLSMHSLGTGLIPSYSFNIKGRDYVFKIINDTSIRFVSQPVNDDVTIHVKIESYIINTLFDITD